MSSLIFHDLPAGAVPLYIGEPREGVLETGTLLLDHVGREVRFVKANPFAPFEVADHDIHRFSWWDVDAMMPRWQLRELYGEARPLLERIQTGTMMSQAPTHWIRTQTPEAQAANALVDELTAQAAEAPVEWVPAPLTLSQGAGARETALERAMRISDEAVRSEFLYHIREKELTGVPINIDERHIRNIIAHGNPEILSGAEWTYNIGNSKTTDSIQFISTMATVKEMLKKDENELAKAALARDNLNRHFTRAQQILHGDRPYSRKGIKGKWGALFEESEVRRIAG